MKIEYFQTISKEGFRRKSKKFSDCQAFSFFKTLLGCRAYSQLQRFLMGTTVIRTISVTGRKVTKQICYFKFSTSNANHLKQSLREKKEIIISVFRMSRNPNSRVIRAE